MIDVAAGAALGLAVGLRHAFEPDHLVAVANLAAETRGLGRGAWVGALWGVGHTAALLGLAIVFLASGAALPEAAGPWIDLAVAAVVVGLGVRALAVAGPVAAGAPSGTRGGAARAVAIGVVHGLAGSGALIALVLAELPDHGTRLGFVVVFGAGSIAGMAVASGAAGLGVGALAHRPRLRRGLIGGAGLISIALGIAWAIAAATEIV